MFALGVLLCEKFRVYQSDQKGFKLKMGVVEENAKGTLWHRLEHRVWCSDVVEPSLGVCCWPSPLLEWGAWVPLFFF